MVLQLGTIVDIVGPDWGWTLPLLWVCWQFYAPQYLERETLWSVHRRKLENIEKLQTTHIMVTRAQARVLDEDLETSMDSENVDDYLVDNGVTVDHFIDEQNGTTDLDRGDDSDTTGGN